MDFGLAGTVALVTGAAGGIGRAVADTLTAEGCRLALVDSGEMAAAGNALALRADVRSWQQADDVVQQVVTHFGRLDILVCCAGITRDAVSWKMTEAQWDEVMAVNLKGCFNYARAAAPIFRERNSGRIVNISSINGLRGKFGQSNYAASKAGIIGLTRSLARELGRHGVTANVVAPGMVDTPMTRSLDREFVENAAHESVLGRISAPEDVAAAVAFLCSTHARQITGAVLRVDAGQYM